MVRSHEPVAIIHVSTAHLADDVRIFERECKSLVKTGRFSVSIAASGVLPGTTAVRHIALPPIPNSRLGRFINGSLRGVMLAKNNAALIWHFHDPELIPVALWLSRKDVIVIWDAHEDYLSQFSDFGSKNWIPKPIRNSVKGLLSRLLTAIDRKASGVIAATPTIAGRYQNQRTVIVGNEVILDDFIDCQPKFESKRVLFTGSTGDSHLFSVVVDAMTRHPELLLVVAGRQKDDHAMREARLRLGDRLLYVGWLYRSELAEEMNRASIGFLTYADTDAYSVASPTKGFEFAAAGLPVVATPNQMNQRLLAEGGFGFLCQGFDAHSISSALKTALSDEQAWKNASMAGKKWCAENGSWTTSEKTLINFYDSLVSFHYSRNKTLRKSSANEW